MKAQHLVVTRFAVKWSYTAFSPEWFDERIRVFRAYCIPGMERQSADDYSWIVLCDESTDPEQLKRIEASAEQVPQLRVVLTSAEQGSHLTAEQRGGIRKAIAALVEDDAEVLITTRLDTDDCVHREFVESVQAYAPAFARSRHEACLVDFPRGYRYDERTGRLYTGFSMFSPFLSLFEMVRPGAAELGGVYLNHRTSYHRFPIHFDDSIPAWIQVVHGVTETAEGRRGTARRSGNLVKTGIKKGNIEVDPAEIETCFGVDLAKPLYASSASGSSLKPTAEASVAMR